MRRTTAGLLSLALASGLGVTLSSQTAFAAAAGRHRTGVDERQDARARTRCPTRWRRSGRRFAARRITRVINGEAAPQNINGSTVVKLGKAAKDSAPDAARAKVSRPEDGANKDQYVELKRETTDRIFVILAEFGNERTPELSRPGHRPGDTPGPTVFDGPLHNEIPEPNRAVDNSTVWQRTTARTTTASSTSARARAWSR